MLFLRFKRRGTHKGFRFCKELKDSEYSPSRCFNFVVSPGMEHQLRWTEISQNGDPSLGRRSFGGEYNWDKPGTDKWFKNDRVKHSACKGVWGSKRYMKWLQRHIRSIVFTFMLTGFLFLLDSLMSSVFNPTLLKNMQAPRKSYDRQVNLDKFNLQEV